MKVYRLINKEQTDGSRRRVGVEGMSKKEGLVDMDNSEVIVGERVVSGGARRYKGDKW